ncbi:MAG: hypothetical protein ABWX93_01455 [Pseudoxanthomonas sp.]
MASRSWNRTALRALLALSSAAGCAVTAQTRLGAQATAPFTPASATAPASVGTDALADALACRIEPARYPGLMREIREERKDDFRQAYRQYSEPMMDVYTLREPVQAWGSQSDTIVIAPNRVMLAVKGTLDAVTRSLEHSLEESSESPLSGALDDQHALVIFEAKQPGLERLVLLGCEYRTQDISLLEDPDDAWRSKPSEAIAPATP